MMPATTPPPDDMHQACRLAWNAYSAEYRRAWRARRKGMVA